MRTETPSACGGIVQLDFEMVNKINKGETYQYILPFLFGFLMRPCCSIPALLTFLGIGGVGISIILEPYRVWFIAAAGCFFTISFYQNFIRNRNRTGALVWILSVLTAGIIYLESGWGMLRKDWKTSRLEGMNMKDNT